MTTATLFGVALAPLFTALAQVESNNGQTSKNIYQLTQKYIDDVNRISKDEAFLWDDRLNREKSERMMCIYWTYYGRLYLDHTGRTPTWETLARIHNGGPDGWKKYGTKKYWRRVQEHLPAEE